MGGEAHRDPTIHRAGGSDGGAPRVILVAKLLALASLVVVIALLSLPPTGTVSGPPAIQPTLTPSLSAPTPTPTPSATTPPCVTGAVSLRGIAFRSTCTAIADVYVSAAVASTTDEILMQHATKDVEQIEAAFSRKFRTRPIAVFVNSEQAFVEALVTLYGFSVEKAKEFVTARGVALICCEAAAVFRQDTVLVTLEASADSVMRHELAHVMQHQLAGRLPRWLDEGIAYTVQASHPASEYIVTFARLALATLARSDSLPPLQQIHDNWQGSPREERYDSAIAAASFLRDDIGMSGLVRLLERIKEVPFERAFEEVVQRPFSAFADSLPTRARALTSAEPGIALVRGSSGAIHFIVYGFPAGAPIQIDRVDPGSRPLRLSPMTTPAQLVTIPTHFRTGEYTVIATSGATSVRATARK